MDFLPNFNVKPPCTNVKPPIDDFLATVLEYGVDDRLLLVVKSLYSYSEIRVHAGKVKSRPFTVGVGLRQECVLSPLFFIVSIT